MHHLRRHPYLPHAVVVLLFLALGMDKLMSRSLFMDGLFYATMARNMAEGLGSIWSPALTETYNRVFLEHPPLVFWSSHWVYHLVGDHYIVDKLISLVVGLLGLVGIHHLWILSGQRKTLSWWPMLLWCVTPLVFWSLGSFMLESFMILFILAAIIAYKYHEKGVRWAIWLIGPLLFLGCLCKAIVGLFPMAMPFLRKCLDKRYSWSSCIKDTLVIALTLFLSAAILFSLSPAAWEYAQTYMDIQVFRSIREVSTVEYRAWILYRCMTEMIPMLLILSVTMIRRVRKWVSITPSQRSSAFFFILLALTAIIPLMVTMKQRGFYLLPGLLLLAFGLALISRPYLEDLSRRWTWASKWASYLFVFLTILNVGLATFFYDEDGRYRDTLNDVALIASVVGEGAIEDTHRSAKQEYLFFAYLYRYHHISLNRNVEGRSYMVSLIDADVDEKKYTPVSIDTRRYRLWSKKVAAGTESP